LSRGDDLSGPAALEKTCRRETPRALYSVPTDPYPTTSILSAKRREAITRVARRHGLAIIKDDAYGALPRQPPDPIAAPSLSMQPVQSGNSSAEGNRSTPLSG